MTAQSKPQGKLSGLIIKKNDTPAITAKDEKKTAARVNKKRVSPTISPTLLDRVDARADEMGISRAAFISMALSHELDR